MFSTCFPAYASRHPCSDSKHQILTPSDKKKDTPLYSNRDLMPHYIKCKLANNVNNMDNPLNGERKRDRESARASEQARAHT